AAVALLELVLGDDQNLLVARRLDGGPQAGDAAADHQEVGEDVRRPLGGEADQVARRERHDVARGQRTGMTAARCHPAASVLISVLCPLSSISARPAWTGRA